LPVNCSCTHRETDRCIFYFEGYYDYHTLSLSPSLLLLLLSAVEYTQMRILVIVVVVVIDEKEK
jgi:hypothetical protein